MYQYIAKMPISQIKIELADLKKNVIAIQRAFKSKNPKNSKDVIDKHCEDMLMEAKEKY